MNLHENKEIFGEYLAATADFIGLQDIGIVEKDYYVTCFLQKITEKQPGIIFKGGTSLSKCYKILNRFSEDIDLSMHTDAAKLSEEQHKRLKQAIVFVIEEFGFSLENPDQIRSRRDFNRYVVNYRSEAANPYLKQYLIVETAVFIKSFPTEKLSAASLIYDFLSAKNAVSEINQYGLAPFEVQVQSIERTFIDKVFALADYYLEGHMENHSRHIYDLYKLYPHIVFDHAFADLAAEVRNVRSPHMICPSAKDGVDLQELLQKIIREDAYKSDYNKITGTLLYEDLPYAEAITVLQKIAEDRYFV